MTLTLQSQIPRSLTLVLRVIRSTSVSGLPYWRIYRQIPEIWRTLKEFDTRKGEMLNSLIMKITSNRNDINGTLQTFRKSLATNILVWRFGEFWRLY